jgi:hypothetical protein
VSTGIFVHFIVIVNQVDVGVIVITLPVIGRFYQYRQDLIKHGSVALDSPDGRADGTELCSLAR